VPSYITIQLLKNEMEAQSQRYNQFLIDGFPRNLENYNSWQQLAKDHSETPFILHLVCTEEEMLRRLKIRS
jgi:adenylate kinase family enzyme